MGRTRKAPGLNPDALLNLIRNLLAPMMAPDSESIDTGDAVRAAEAFADLDRHIGSGGALPRVWDVPRGAAGDGYPSTRSGVLAMLHAREAECRALAAKINRLQRENEALNAIPTHDHAPSDTARSDARLRDLMMPRAAHGCDDCERSNGPRGRCEHGKVRRYLGDASRRPLAVNVVNADETGYVPCPYCPRCATYLAPHEVTKGACVLCGSRDVRGAK